MASRTLTLALAADIDGLKKGLDDADKVVKKSSDQIIDFGKKAAAAFAVVGAAATAFAISSVKMRQLIRLHKENLKKQFVHLQTLLLNKLKPLATTSIKLQLQ